MNLGIESNKGKENKGGIENMQRNTIYNPSCKPEMHNEDSMAEVLGLNVQSDCLTAEANKKRRALRMGFDKNQLTSRKDENYIIKLNSEAVSIKKR